MDASTGIHLRKTPRRDFQRSVGVLCRGEYHVGQSEQIGEGGMKFYSPHPLTQGTQIIVTFMIPAGGMVSLRAEVLYTESGEAVNSLWYGCRFLDVPFQPRRWIRNYVAAKTEKEATRDLSLLEKSDERMRWQESKKAVGSGDGGFSAAKIKKAIKP